MNEKQHNTQISKDYTYDSLVIELNDHLKKYDITVTNTDIFEHSLLHIASITETPSSTFMESPTSQQEIKITFNFFPYKTAIKFISILQEKFGEDFCRYTPGNDNERTICFSLTAVMQYMDKIKLSIDEILSNPRNLMAYQRYAEYYTPFSYYLGDITRKFNFDQQHNWVGMVLLKMFGCTEVPLIAGFAQGQNYIGKKMDVHFFLTISEKTAKCLIENINQKFPNYDKARFIRSDVKLPSYIMNLNGDFCEIVIDATLLESKEFQPLFEETIDITLDDSLLSEQFKSKPITEIRDFNCCFPDCPIFFNDRQITELIKKYQLKDMSQPYLEQGLRNAAAKGQWNEIRVFNHFTVNIDAKDSNPKQGKTPLHWAAKNNYRDCYELLIDYGAKDDIPDLAENKTPAQYLSEHAKKLTI